VHKTLLPLETFSSNYYIERALQLMRRTSIRNTSETVTGKDACKIDDDRESLVYKIRFQREGLVNAFKDCNKFSVLIPKLKTFPAGTL
jgi:hypothetical protein